LITYLHFDALDSTNSFAESLVRTKRPQTPYVITTDYQTKGKGTQDRIWYAQRGESLLYTLVFFSESPVIEVESMVLAAAEEVQSMIFELLQIKMEIKKPNDLFMNKKKCGGILIKNIMQGKQCWTIIGIGLNVNTLKFPKELELIATSLFVETQKIIQISDLTTPLTNRLLNRYEKTMNNK